MSHNIIPDSCWNYVITTQGSLRKKEAKWVLDIGDGTIEIYKVCLATNPPANDSNMLVFQFRFYLRADPAKFARGVAYAADSKHGRRAVLREWARLTNINVKPQQY